MAKMTEREKFIVNSIEKLEITRQEAEELWAFDHDEIEVPEVKEIEVKIADNKAGEKRSSIEKVKYMKAKKKKDELKDAVLAGIFEAVENCEVTILPQKIATTKMSFMDANGSFYTVAITKHKGQPDGYSPMKEKKESNVSLQSLENIV